MMIASSGSPSGPRVEGTKPESYGYAKPVIRGRDSVMTPSSGSYLSFRIDPRGDSTTTRKASSSANVGRVNRPAIDPLHGAQARVIAHNTMRAAARTLTAPIHPATG